MVNNEHMLSPLLRAHESTYSTEVNWVPESIVIWVGRPHRVSPSVEIKGFKNLLT